MANEIQTEQFEQITLMGIQGLFSNGRIPADVVPEGLHRYNLRGSDSDPGIPVTVEHKVGVNHAGTVVLLAPIDLGDAGWRKLTDKNGLSFLGNEISIQELHQNQMVMRSRTEIERPEQLIVSAASMGLSFTKEEAKIVLGYLDGCDYVLMETPDRQIFRHDREAGQDFRNDEEYSIMDAVDFAMESNIELIEENKDASTEQEKEYLSQLHHDEQTLDFLCDKIREALDEMQQSRVSECIFDISMTAAAMMQEGTIQAGDSRELFSTVYELAQEFERTNIHVGDSYMMKIEEYARTELAARFAPEQEQKPMSLAQRLAAARSAVENQTEPQTVKPEQSVVR